MNQTEILRLRAGAQNKSIQNIHNSTYTNQNSSITIIKANTYQINRDKTPKAQISKANSSSNKLIRVSSSKGINVSLRPTSSQKQVKQFNSSTNISTACISSQTTIKLDDHQQVVNQMQQQLKKAIQKYQDKMNKQLSYQHNFLTVEIDRLKQLLVQNQSKLKKQQFQLSELINRVQSVEKKIETKTNLMAKQLVQFKNFYDQCYNYTIKRVSQAESNMKTLAKHIDQVTSTTQNIQTWKYIQYANHLVKKIVSNCSAQSSSLKYYINEQIYQLQMQIAKFHDKYQQLDNIVYEMKSIKFGNQSLKDHIRQLGKFGITTNNIRKDFHKQNFLEYYQPKFKQIIKRVNNSAIQIDLVKNLIKSQSQNEHSKLAQNYQKIQQLSLIIKNMQNKMQQQKLWYSKQLELRQEILSKSNPRILELETKLHSCYEHEGKLMKEVSDLKLKVSYYQTKCEKNSQRQYGIQSTLAEAYAQTLLKQKTKKFVQQKLELQSKITGLEQKIKQLDNQNYLLAEKLSKSSSSMQQYSKLQAQLKFATKIIQEYQQSEHKVQKQVQNAKKQVQQAKKQAQCNKKQSQNLRAQSQKYKQQLQNRNKQIQQLMVQVTNIKLLNEQQKLKSTCFETKLKQIINQKNQVKQDDDKYFTELQEEVQSCYKQIQRLENANKQIVNKCHDLNQRNLQLQADLHNYAQTFEKQSITFRNALQNLQKQKDFLGIQNKKISEQLKSLKLQYQPYRTTQSFYQFENNSNIQLRKTVSTDLGSHMRRSQRKLQNKIHSINQKSNKVTKLKNVLQKLKYELPVVCEIDATGYLKDQRTGCYFVDENQNYFYLDQSELEAAVKLGFILL